MNDLLIKELAKEAGYELDMFGIGHWDSPECKKLVELIVRQCAVLCRWEHEAHAMLKHFGVEE